MDKKLSKPPQQVPLVVHSPPQATKTGLGKGNPCIPRKENVSKRQARKMALKRKAAQTCTSATPGPSPKRITPRPSTADLPVTPLCSPIVCSTPPGSAALQSSSTPRSRRRKAQSTPPLAAPQREERQQLLSQTKLAANIKRVALIQALAGAGRDEPANDKELELFWNDMDAWGKLDSRLVDALARIWNDHTTSASGHTLRDDLTCQLLKLDALSNGVRNCIAHLMGSLLAFKFNNSDETNIQVMLENTELNLKRMRHDEYLDYLRKCGCKSCDAVVSFDENYERYCCKKKFRIL